MEEDNKRDFEPISKIMDGRPGYPRGKGWWWSCFSHLVLFFWEEGLGGGGLLPGHISSFPHHPPTPPPPPSPQGECVCAERVNMGGGGARVFNNAAFKCCSSAHILCRQKKDF